MNLRNSANSLTSILIAALASACYTADPDDLENTDSGSSSDMHEGTSSPTEGTDTGAEDSPSDDESSGGSSEDGGVAVVCNPADNYEPNDNENDAKKLPNITDADGPGEHVESILAGELDVDWFAYMGTDVAIAYVDPTSAIDADMEVRLCLFVECVNGPTMPVSCLDSVYEESPELTLPGCCNFGGSTLVAIDLYCDAGGDESAYIFMRVDQGNSDICIPYEITYHF